ncbi:disease resistance protein RPM1-like isoform X2 [Typha angustifolia]|uniref:disease resistance protein RPM1-like isoform X2 n=1 Tax=Typha angustifolia TaxID=59011 RepID=UPI003C2E1158
MAEALVFQILYKLGSIVANDAVKALSSQLGKEVANLIQVESQIKQIESELNVMHPFLYQAQRYGGYDATLQAWLQQVQNLAFEIEDIIDEYTYLISSYQSGFQGFLKNTFHKSKNINSWHKVATELKEIQNRLHNLSRMKERYSITLTKEIDTSYLAEGLHDSTFSSYPMDYNELVGIQEEREKIMQHLTTEEKQTSIISVWGMGGSGKTTLVRNIYESKIIKEHFDHRFWVSISQKYQLEDILREMVKNVFTSNENPVSIQSMSCTDLKELLQRNLQDKRYLIVLDDVWSRDVWIKLSTIFSENNSRGRVVITTRLKDVAELATENYDLELKNLHESEAWDLFCRWAFRNMEDKKCPEDLEQWGRKIVDKCHGLPLAIVVVGNLLSFRRMKVAEWERFYNEINWELHDSLDNQHLSSVMRVLNLSYNHLPSHLKNCFLFCSIFPEDYLIPRKRLIKLWVAEGLVASKSSSTKTVEEIAEGYLSELIDRCLLQVVERNNFGRVKSCQMHDLVRELAISISVKENFCTAYDKSQMRMVNNNARRVASNEYNDSIQSSIKFSHLRSFYLFDTANFLPTSLSWVSQSVRYLRVLDIQNAPITSLPDDIFNLFNLCYLGLRNTNIKQLSNSLGKLHKLQTLDLCNTAIKKLPSTIVELKELRHLFAEKQSDGDFRNFHYLTLSGVEAPKGLWHLTDLQTLQSIEATMDFVRKVGNLTQLRTFRIESVKKIHCYELFKSISKMQFLSNLDVFASDENEYINLEALSSLSHHLQKLCLEGRLQEGVLASPVFQSLRVNLKWLNLGWCKLEKDPLGDISCLSSLTRLGLQRAYEGKELIFQPGWFPNLKILILIDMPCLEFISFEKSVQSLGDLRLVGLTQLKEIPQGMNSLVFLQQLNLWDMHPEFIRNIQVADGKNKTKHIPVINYSYENAEGRWSVVNLAQATVKVI